MACMMVSRADKGACGSCAESAFDLIIFVKTISKLAAAIYQNSNCEDSLGSSPITPFADVGNTSFTRLAHQSRRERYSSIASRIWAIYKLPAQAI